MKKTIKKFLKRMVKNGGYIANGVYDELPRYWHDDFRTSSRLMDIVLFNYLLRERLIYKDKMGRYFPSEKGKQFAKYWWERFL